MANEILSWLIWEVAAAAALIYYYYFAMELPAASSFTSVRLVLLNPNFTQSEVSRGGSLLGTNRIAGLPTGFLSVVDKQFVQ